MDIVSPKSLTQWDVCVLSAMMNMLMSMKTLFGAVVGSDEHLGTSGGGSFGGM